MTPPPFRCLSRTSRGAVGALPSAVALGYALVVQLPTWRGDWWWGYNSLSQAVPIVMLVVALVVGWDAGSSSTGYRALVERGPVSRARVVLALVTVPLGLALILFTVATLGVVGLTVSAGGEVDRRAPLIVGSHVLMIVLAATVGLVAGRALASPYAALTAGAVVGVLLFMSVGRGQHVFGFAGASGSIVGSTPSLPYYAVNLAVILGASLLLLIALTTRALSPLPLAAALAIAVVGIAAACAVGPSDQFTSSGARADRCLETSVEVCVYPGYDRLLPGAAQRISTFIARASGRGVPASSFPSRFEQYGGTAPRPGVGVLEVPVDALRSGKVDSTALAGSVSTPLWCDAMFAAAPPEGLLRRRQEVYDWTLLVDGALTTDGFADRHPDTAGLTAAQIAARVTDDLRRLRRCDNG